LIIIVLHVNVKKLLICSFEDNNSLFIQDPLE
jgi:hypothetical protein